jgi:hypothetical protein
MCVSLWTQGDAMCMPLGLPLIRAIKSTARIGSEKLTDKALATIKALLRHTRWGRQYCEPVFGAVYQTEHLELLKLLLECDGELKVRSSMQNTQDA